jgi:ubiquinone/menaquinone biosynthesis C-methylase UbiE
MHRLQKRPQGYTAIKSYTSTFLFQLVISMEAHERNVEKFYTKGSKRLLNDGEGVKHKEEGFISFGYWENDSDTYLDAARRLLKFVIENSGVKKAERILNVACGYGTESFAYFDSFKPKEVVGIDITQVHVDYANEQSRKKGLSKKVKFIHGDAVELKDFPDNHFSHIMGIEGPAHFNTRERFFKSANRVLKDGGEILLTDIILGKKYRSWNPFHNLILRLGARGWVVPMANGVNEEQYRRQLEHSGFQVEFIRCIGDRVFPGYAQSFSHPSRKDDQKMGAVTAFGFKLIGKFLGYAYKKGWIEYIYMKAKKVSP